MSLYPKLRAWLTQRYDVDVVEHFVDGQLHKPLPKETGFWHTFGSLSLFLFLNQVVTGILLMVYYRPTTNTAFESVRYIMTKAYFGWLARKDDDSKQLIDAIDASLLKLTKAGKVKELQQKWFGVDMNLPTNGIPEPKY